ncbi:hypothetical protein DEJ44_31020 [Streptomyces venezuelae]|uniref:hypothetical protein n=1 Tax=Streptomyces venezuelae TaxID=54571 RepID=UPI001239F0C2|nr:hypothetical protein [Streptomyces venezuelae]QES09628.1 hypothetical protein DEJ44_31020 [Streptomyces venezuelae]
MPSTSDLGLRTTYRWTSDGTALRLGAEVEPEGDRQVPLPRLGVLLGLPAALDRAECDVARAAFSLTFTPLGRPPIPGP